MGIRSSVKGLGTKAERTGRRIKEAYRRNKKALHIRLKLYKDKISKILGGGPSRLSEIPISPPDDWKEYKVKPEVDIEDIRERKQVGKYMSQIRTLRSLTCSGNRFNLNPYPQRAQEELNNLIRVKKLETLIESELSDTKGDLTEDAS